MISHFSLHQFECLSIYPCCLCRYVQWLYMFLVFLVWFGSAALFCSPLLLNGSQLNVLLSGKIRCNEEISHRKREKGKKRMKKPVPRPRCTCHTMRRFYNISSKSNILRRLAGNTHEANKYKSNDGNGNHFPFITLQLEQFCKIKYRRGFHGFQHNNFSPTLFHCSITVDECVAGAAFVCC